MTENEQWYDAEIAPALMALAERCKERGISLVAVAEYAPGERGATYQLAESAGLEMRMLQMCGVAGANVDGYMIGLARYCKRHGIDTSASMFMARPNVELTGAERASPAKRPR